MHAAAVGNLDGSCTLLVVNDHYTNCAGVLVRMPTGAGAVRKIVNDPVRKHEEVAGISARSNDIEYADVLSPMSLTVSTTVGV